ncbi:MAG: hypothetical protein Q7R83_03850, partial [bacterium]|nr:hypothetical protein [bacterium]
KNFYHTLPGIIEKMQGILGYTLKDLKINEGRIQGWYEELLNDGEKVASPRAVDLRMVILAEATGVKPSRERVIAFLQIKVNDLVNAYVNVSDEREGYNIDYSIGEIKQLAGKRIVLDQERLRMGAERHMSLLKSLIIKRTYSYSLNHLMGQVAKLKKEHGVSLAFSVTQEANLVHGYLMACIKQIEGAVEQEMNNMQMLKPFLCHDFVQLFPDGDPLFDGFLYSSSVTEGETIVRSLELLRELFPGARPFSQFAINHYILQEFKEYREPHASLKKEYPAQQIESLYQQVAATSAPQAVKLMPFISESFGVQPDRDLFARVVSADIGYDHDQEKMIATIKTHQWDKILLALGGQRADIGEFCRLMRLSLEEGLDEQTEQEFNQSASAWFRDRVVDDPRSAIKRRDTLKKLPTPEILKLYETDPWMKAFLKIHQLQATSSNEENDPWIKEFRPFFASIQGVLDLHKSEDAEILVQFIRENGMVNLPQLFSVYAVCQRAKICDEIPPEIVETIEQDGIRLRKNTSERDWRFPNPKAILVELKRNTDAFVERLLAGEERVVESALGQERFARFIGHSQWGRGDSVAALEGVWMETRKKNPEASRLPAAFQPASLFVREKVRGSSTEPALEDGESRLARYLATSEVKEQGEALSRSIHTALNWYSPVLLNHQRVILTSLQTMREEIRRWLDRSPEEIEELIHLAKNEEEKRALEKKKRALANPKGRANMEKQTEQLKQALEVAEGLNFEFASEGQLVETIEQLSQLVAVCPAVNIALRDVSAIHMDTVMPDGWSQELRAAFIASSELTPERILILEKWCRDFMREHYLHPEQKKEHTGHTPFSKNALLELQRVWRQQESAKGKVPIEMIADKIRAARSPSREFMENRLAISMIPSNGLLRIHAGDLGDGCHTAQHYPLASGQLPGVYAWTYFVETKEKKTEIIPRGSLVGIATKKLDGTPVLVARANNPRENFIQSVNETDLVLQSLKEVIATARRLRDERVATDQGSSPAGKCQSVAIPLDKASQSSTNRPMVAAVYASRFGSCQRVDFVNSPDTNFNGYSTWSGQGTYGCGVIWEMDENGKETWFGDWSEK